MPLEHGFRHTAPVRRMDFSSRHAPGLAAITRVNLDFVTSRKARRVCRQIPERFDNVIDHIPGTLQIVLSHEFSRLVEPASNSPPTFHILIPVRSHHEYDVRQIVKNFKHRP